MPGIGHDFNDSALRGVQDDLGLTVHAGINDDLPARGRRGLH
jgi:hypothetical protein